MFYEIERRLLRREHVSVEEDGVGEIEDPKETERRHQKTTSASTSSSSSSSSPEEEESRS